MCIEGFSEVEGDCFKSEDQAVAEGINDFTKADIAFQTGMTTAMAANPNMLLVSMNNLQQLSFLGNLKLNYPPLVRNMF